MKVLVTGGNGFVGSHIVDALAARRIPVVLLLRKASNARFIDSQLQEAEVRTGSVDDLASLRKAVSGVSHVVHCAGLTRARHVSEFYEVNQAGTRRLVEAVNEQRGSVERLVFVSSLSAAGPALPGHPARELDPPHPVSEYGRSKLAGEGEVADRCAVSYTILRPPSVYGPRDEEFLRLFKAVKAHLLASFDGGRQELSFVYVEDLAQAVVAALSHPGADRETFFVAAQEIVTAGAFARMIASELGAWTVPVRLPASALWPVCAWEEWRARLRGKASVLSRQKIPELRAAAWTCDPARLRERLGFSCQTSVREGIRRTLAWYRRMGWL
jgi:nucleoside-diphosphate-sugar epimerase